MIRICNQEHHGVCFNCPDELGWALTAAAKTAKPEVTQLLLLYTKNSLHRAFTAAIQSQSADIVDIILANNPDIDAPAHSLEFGAIQSCYYVTSFSEAIKTGNDKVIKMTLDRGHLDKLEHGSRFHPAVTAAAKMNDLGLLRGLLERQQHPHPAELGPALIQALKYGNREAAMILLDAGASTSIWYADRFPDGSPGRSYTDWNVLLDALEGRDSNIVYALLDAAHDRARVREDRRSRWREGDYNPRKILRAAVVWGDESILTALFTTFPSMLVEHDELAETLENNNIATFNFLSESLRVTPSAINKSLKYSIEKNTRDYDQNVSRPGSRLR